MGKNTGFLEKSRKIVPYRDPLDRAKDFGEIFTHAPTENLKPLDAWIVAFPFVNHIQVVR